MPDASFGIDLHFDETLSSGQRQVFQEAADGWSRVIVRPLPPVQVDGAIIKNLRINISTDDIDGPGNRLGFGGPTVLRPPEAGTAAYLPALSRMTFDRADLAAMEADETLAAVVLHEMGHALGFGTQVWNNRQLVHDDGRGDPRYVGARAIVAYNALRGTAEIGVPLENHGGNGVVLVHWREAIFGDELMSSYVLGASNPLSAVTIAALADMGYAVDPLHADPYRLPSPTSSMLKLFAPPRRRKRHAVELEATEPIVLGPDALLPQ